MEMAMNPPRAQVLVLLGHPVILRSSNRRCSRFSAPKTQEDPSSPELYLFASKLIAKRLN